MSRIAGAPDSVRTAILPVAGLGTRFLPATKAVPKEMLPVAGRPLVQYAVQEALDSGIERVVLVAAPGRDLALRHFARDQELEAALAARGRSQAQAEVRMLATFGERLTAIEQAEPLGLGHAVGCATRALGPGPYAVILPDDLVLGHAPCLRQLLDVHDRLGGTVLAVTSLPPEELRNFGVVAPGVDDGIVVEVQGLVEKPAPGSEPSQLAVVGRYVLSPEVCAALPTLAPGAGGELQLTDAVAATIGTTPVHAVRFEGRRFDCGNPTGMVAAGVAVALADAARSAAVATSVRALLSGMDGEQA